jgi:branched-chain amino acid transport system permease protein
MPILRTEVHALENIAAQLLVVIFMRGGLWGGLSALFERVRGSRKTAAVVKEEGL